MDLKSATRSAFTAALKGGDVAAAIKSTESDDSHEHGTYDGGSDTDGGDYADADDPDSKVGPEDIHDLDAEPEVDADGDSTDSGEDGQETGDAEESTPASTETDPQSTTVEEVVIDDGEGGKRAIQVDFSDRDKLKRYIQIAAGTHKSAAKHKAELAARDAELATHKEDAELGRKFVDVWQKGGVDGLIRELTGGKQTWDSLYEERAKLEGWKKQATPEQLAAFDAQQAAEQAKREAAEARAALEADRKKADESKVAAERTQLQGAMEAGLGKFGFTGKLGDSAREHKLNRQAWAAVQAEIADLPDDTVVDQALINRLWAEQTEAVRGAVETQVRKETTQVVKQKAREAKTNAQTAMRTASRKPANTVDEQIKRGGFKQAIRSALIRANAR